MGRFSVRMVSMFVKQVPTNTDSREEELAGRNVKTVLAIFLKRHISEVDLGGSVIVASKGFYP